ncbi:MAG: class I SAM-dependent methyltransferase [Chloroflexi bacterium]|nr:class I SAM-dependent methyltransferase [Chloroflexota bacterium]MBU1751971.1 class I SAM-dependent methyltransferase [Chloroflexota bacterium]
MTDTSNDQRRMYGDLAWTWPIVSRKENYVEEAEAFRDAIREHALIPAQMLLHLGCGGGHLDFTLKRYFTVTAIDVSEDMLALARRLNPEVAYQPGDMRSARFEQPFDAVMAGDSINYMLTQPDLRAAFETAYVCLKPGGVFCTYAEETVERFRQHKTDCFTRAQGDVAITFVYHSYDPDQADTTYESTFVYLIRRGGQLQVETDRHLSGLFPLDTWLRLLRDVGFQVAQLEFDEDNVPMFACVKPFEEVPKC